MSKVYECDISGNCPYGAYKAMDCRNFCGLGVDESENEYPDEDELVDYPDDVDETNYNPYMGCDDFEFDNDGDGLDF